MAAAVPRDREAGRHREVRLCLDSWQTAQGSAINVALNVDNIGLANLQRTGYAAQPSPDRTLTAFAQLAVLRLNVDRAMVSLIDTSTQTILAEANRDDSRSPDTGARPPTVLWLGTTTIARQDAVCPACLDSTYTATSAATGPDGAVITQTTQAFIVPDCTLDPRFQNRPYVRDSPFIRFYAGVPIISRNGHKIGAYAVSDGIPRDGLSLQDVQFMQGMAQTIMEHLEWARDRVDRFKGERIVRGLAAFIETSSGQSDSAHSRAASTASTDHHAKTPQAVITSPRHPLSRQTSYFGARAASTSTAAPAHIKSPSVDRSRGLHETLDAQALPSPGPGPETSERKGSKGKSSRKRSSSDTMSTMLQQAADILCQSTLADGAVLLGASATTSRQTSWAPANSTNGRFSSDDDEPVVSSPDISELPGQVLENMASPSTFRGDKRSRVLAYSIMDQQTRGMFEQGKGALTLGTLEKYYSLFPKGKAFSFTGQGASITSEDDSASERETPRESGPSNTTTSQQHGDGHGKADQRDHQHQQREQQHYHHHRARRKPKTDHTELLQRIPGAKTVVFVPLFDHAENSFSGGCFLWTSVAGRLMNLDEDLSYLRAFANSIMSQVARISAQKNEAAKTTFIASMSHELRSPLHGILGAAEFLADTSADSFQAGLVSSISTCGKTLLDTLNHVLDYSKINRLGRSRRRRQLRGSSEGPATGGISSDSLDSLNLTAVVDLSALVEEVIDAIVTGHTFKQVSTASLPESSDKSHSLGKLAPTPHVSLARDEPVSVLVDISPPGTWLVRTQPGALRRIVMNLFGNALKYTSAGYVMVSLTVKQTTESEKTEVLIRVIDSGKGMSAEFQRNRLFVPFMQEDHFQPGTGLGLSIVKQIVDSLGGSIDVASEQGKGTEIDVRASLPTAIEHGHVDQELAWIRKHARGLRMVILDNDIEAQAGKAAARHAHRLNHVIAKTCYSWFGLNVAHEEDGAGLDADIFMYCEPPSMDTLEKRFKNDKTLSSRKWQIPVIIVCLDAQEVLRISQSQKEVLTKGYGRIVELIPQPCGPRKLAKVIELCLRKAEELANKPDRANEQELSARLHLQSKKKRPTPHEKQRRDDMTYEDAKKDELQTDPTSIPVRPMNDENMTSMTDEETKNQDEKSLRVVEKPSEPSVLEGEVDAMGYDDVTRRERVGASGAVELPSLQNAIEKDKTPQLPKSEQLRVLVVDDNKINLQLLVMFMKKSGFTYEAAENGKEALDKYKAAHEGSRRSPASERGHESGKARTRGGFDWVLMDISMPIMDGIEATRHIREFEREHDLEPASIVALTGLASADAQRDAKVAGVDIFMAKPVRFAALKKEMLGTKAPLRPPLNQISQ